MKKILVIGVALAALAATPAAAAEYVFTTTGSSALNGTAGNTRNYSATSGSSTLNLQTSAWQLNKSTGAVNSAFLGAWSAGLGVTGNGDYSGDYGLHQVDNHGGYVDFIFMQFSQAVTLEALGMYSYGISGVASADHDFATFALNLASPQWNSLLNLSTAGLNTSGWLEVFGGGSSGSFDTGATGSSRQWLVAAAPSHANDAFKLNSVTVESAVPEPGTWAMMLMGFGAMGFALRRGRGRKPALAAA